MDIDTFINLNPEEVKVSSDIVSYIALGKIMSRLAKGFSSPPKKTYLKSCYGILILGNVILRALHEQIKLLQESHKNISSIFEGLLGVKDDVNLL